MEVYKIIIKKISNEDWQQMYSILTEFGCTAIFPERVIVISSQSRNTILKAIKPFQKNDNQFYLYRVVDLNKEDLPNGIVDWVKETLEELKRKELIEKAKREVQEKTEVMHNILKVAKRKLEEENLDNG